MCVDDNQEAKASKRIDSMLKPVKEGKPITASILLLGAGESGKSTFLKQLTLLHGPGFTEKDLAMYADAVRDHIVCAASSLVSAAEKSQLSFTDTATLDEFSQQLLDSDKTTPLMLQLAKKLWSDPITTALLAQANQFHFSDSDDFFMNQFDRVSASGYVPTTDDCLRVRVQTTGVVAYNFEVQNRRLQVYDVGGQRSERKKWYFFLILGFLCLRVLIPLYS